jgi:hypothetical protein
MAFTLPHKLYLTDFIAPRSLDVGFGLCTSQRNVLNVLRKKKITRDLVQDCGPCPDVSRTSKTYGRGEQHGDTDTLTILHCAMLHS